MGCFFSKSTKSDDDYASFINNDTMELLIKNDESIFIDDNNGINQYELNKLVINRLITLENNIEELSKDIHHLNKSVEGNPDSYSQYNND
jgi:hypothetical protein